MSSGIPVYSVFIWEINFRRHFHCFVHICTVFSYCSWMFSMSLMNYLWDGKQFSYHFTYFVHAVSPKTALHFNPTKNHPQSSSRHYFVQRVQSCENHSMPPFKTPPDRWCQFLCDYLERSLLKTNALKKNTQPRGLSYGSDCTPRIVCDMTMSLIIHLPGSCEQFHLLLIVYKYIFYTFQ